MSKLSEIEIHAAWGFAYLTLTTGEALLREFSNGLSGSLFRSLDSIVAR